MADMGGIQRAPESLLAVRRVVQDVSSIFEYAELGDDNRGIAAYVDSHLYRMVVTLSDTIGGELATLLANEAKKGILNNHEEMDGAIQAFTRSTQTLLRNVVESEDDWGNPEFIDRRIRSWKKVWYTLSSILILLLKAELRLGLQCASRDVISKEDAQDAQFLCYQILTHRSDVFDWEHTRQELRHASSEDKRAMRLVSELRMKRALDRLTISVSVGEEIIDGMWRADEKEEEEESLTLKNSAMIALRCIKQTITKMESIIDADYPHNSRDSPQKRALASRAVNKKKERLLQCHLSQVSAAGGGGV